MVCQGNKFPKQKFLFSKGTCAGISRVLHRAGIRESFPDETYSKRSLEIVNSLEKNRSQDVFWHWQCYSDFTKEGHIQLL